MSANNPRLRSSSDPHVVVIGAGYAGALAANRLQQNRDIQITIINPRPVFVERVRLHEFVAGSGDATVDLADLLGERVHLIVDTATRINAAARTVELESGSQVSYDYLVYAVGSTGTVPEGVRGARAHAYPISELEQAERLRAAVALLPKNAPICVVGGGLTGIETASELAEQRPDAKVSLLCGGILAPSVGEKARASVARQLTRLGVAVEDDAVVAEVLADRVRLSDGRSLPSGVTVWTAGFGVPDLAVRSGLTTDSIGRLVTDETLTSVDDPWIIGAGDASAPAGPALRMSCQAAMPLAARATSTVLARIAGTEVNVLNQSFVGSNISIGRRHGTIATARHDDSPRGLYIGGWLAAVIKEMVCATVVKQIAKESRKPGSYRWPGANKRPDAVAPTPAG
ncbi:NAD(P)/FAD-dependent oxidoreductase [Mycolicibacterium confluentis]|uniref:Dehydrogenase n=1 Tax=Mycolicibacterium confluentis TaxID=28047 RepID=A0A7I7XZ85_9MYCO|nr:FAD-dependent oxidoreductase [Mycolicibacterium confluentis]MCV7319595.1 FAD-dependent oxidoreductase [Mycolicibacterium confluentis]ORV34205.1 pyridine nucleotide-disulfide oxidoreductase [Mycolicibacterium confluentis]BBZ34617.1 dehydrogenase [Mycolicibacterium confluentis]